MKEIMLFKGLNGSCLVDDFISCLPLRDKKIVINMILKRLAERPLDELLKVEIVKKFKGENLFELIRWPYRIFFTERDSRYWLLSAFRKKGYKTPPSELSKALRLKEELFGRDIDDLLKNSLIFN